MTDEWFSDAALERQRALREWPKDAGPAPLEMICGIWEPRTQPTEAERCHHCRSDARDGTGGRDVHGFRYCDLCVSRGRVG
jgi:hypothetical protein